MVESLEGWVAANPLCTVLIGFGGTLILGFVLPKCVRSSINCAANEYLNDVGSAVVPPEIIGLIEQMFFAGSVAFLPPNALAGVLPAMMLWVAAKLAANWEHQKPRSRKIRGKSIRAVALSATSLGVALVGGLIARWGLFHLGLKYLKG